jgi:hypothetical protein
MDVDGHSPYLPNRLNRLPVKKEDVIQIAHMEIKRNSNKYKLTAAPAAVALSAVFPRYVAYIHVLPQH